MKRHFAFVVLITVLLGASAFGGTTGKIAGRIMDADGKTPLVGANVLVVNTMLGASTDVDGFYSIINIPPGTYQVKITMVGYQTVIERGIAVTIDRTTPLNASLAVAAVGMDAVEVVAARPDIVRDRTATVQKVSAAEIEKLPAKSLGDLLRLQAGVTKDENGTLHLRGGRASEIQYYVDGMAVSNPFSGGLAVNIQNSAIQETEVISGAFNAEYGQAMSGIMNIVTKEGGDQTHATLSLESGDFLSDREDMFMHIKSVNPFAQRYVDGSLSGPLPLLEGRGHYFVSARYRKEENWLFGQRRFTPADTTNFRAVDPAAWTESASGDNAIVPLNPAEDFSLQGKISYRLLDELKATYSAQFDHLTTKPYDNATSHPNMFNPDFLPTRRVKGLNNMLTLTHTLSPSFYQELKLTYYWTDSRTSVADNPFDPIYQIGIHRYTSNVPQNVFHVGGVDPWFTWRKSTTAAAKYEITGQVDRYNLVKVGAEYRQYMLQEDRFQMLRDETTNWQLAISGLDAQTHNFYRRKPLEFAAYIQDKIEIEDFIVNAGIRFDYFNARSSYPLISEDPADKRGTPWDSAFAMASPKSQISPRLGLAFPISDNGTVHASYGQFFQIPEFARLYENPENEVVGRFETYLGNANLEAQRTTVYEIGLQQKVAANVLIDGTCYYKDYRNLAGTVLYRTFDQDEYGQYANADYGHVWGITLSLDLLKTGMLSANLNYTYQVANGNGSDPKQAYFDALNRNEAAKWLVPLNWDQTHVVNGTVWVDGDFWGFSTIATYSSGLPYTPATTFLPQPNVQLTNEARWNPEFNVDLRAYVNVNLWNLTAQLFGSVENLFDRTRPERLPQLSVRDLGVHAPKARFNSLYDYLYEPGFQPAPRLVRLGLKFAL